jgi:Zn-dependent protease with chaperone function
VSAAPADLRRAAGDPAVLPTTLSARFLVLFVLILASTASVYGYLGIRLGRPGETRVSACLDRSALDDLRRLDPGGMPDLIGDTTPVISCVAPDMSLIVLSSLAGLLLVVVCALLAAAADTPWRLRLRPGRFQPLARYDPEAAAEVTRLAGVLRLPRPPVVLVGPPGDPSYVFGTGRRPHLCLARETVQARDRDPGQFTAIALHELAHLKNRDTGPTLLLSTAWWSFLTLAVTPYLALLAADAAGLLPRARAFRHDDLHTVVAISAMLALVALTRLAVLRDRELTADATAGRHDGQGVLRAFMDRDDPGGPAAARPRTGWLTRPMVLRTHPALSQRRRVVAEPWTLPPLSFLQLVGAGIGLAVLSQDAGTFAWQALIAAGVDPVPSPGMSFLLIMVAALASAGPIGALAWLVESVTWQRRLAAPSRPPVAVAALGLGAGMLVGEPAAVSAANASHWGVFDGIGDGSAGAALVSALSLVGILAALSRWSWDNAGAWLPAVRGSLRRASRWSAVAGTVAVLPWYATWWSMHDAPLSGRLYLWTPGFAEALTYRSVPLPAGEWLQATYVPWDMLAWAPGVTVLTVLPVLVTLAGLLRRRTPRTPRWLGSGDATEVVRPPDHRPPPGRAVLIGAAGSVVLVLIGTTLASAAHTGLADLDRLNGADRVEFLHYLFATATLLTAAVGAIAAAVATLSHPSRSVVYGLVSALTVGCAGAVTTPAMVGVARWGLTDPGSSLTTRLFSDYRLFFGLAGTAQPVKAVIAALMVAGLAALVRRRPPVADRRPAGRTVTVLIGSGAAAAVTSLAAAAWFNFQ